MLTKIFLHVRNSIKFTDFKNFVHILKIDRSRKKNVTPPPKKGLFLALFSLKMVHVLSLFWHHSKLAKNGPFCCKNSPAFWYFGSFLRDILSPQIEKMVFFWLYLALKWSIFCHYFDISWNCFFGLTFISFLSVSGPDRAEKGPIFMRGCLSAVFLCQRPIPIITFP